MKLETKVILVTGGAGYIGSHACKALAKAGYTPFAYDNLVYGHEWVVKWGPFEKGDILDRKRLDEVINQYLADDALKEKSNVIPSSFRSLAKVNGDGSFVCMIRP